MGVTRGQTFLVSPTITRLENGSWIVPFICSQKTSIDGYYPLMHRRPRFRVLDTNIRTVRKWGEMQNKPARLPHLPGNSVALPT